MFQKSRSLFDKRGGFAFRTRGMERSPILEGHKTYLDQRPNGKISQAAICDIPCILSLFLLLFCT